MPAEGGRSPSLSGLGSGGVAIFISDGASRSDHTGDGLHLPRRLQGGLGWSQLKVLQIPEAGPLSLYGSALAVLDDDSVIVAGGRAAPQTHEALFAPSGPVWLEHCAA